MAGLVPHICGHKNEMILNDLSLDAQFQIKRRTWKSAEPPSPLTHQSLSEELGKL